MKIITKLLCFIALLASIASCSDKDNTKNLVEQLKTSYDYDGQIVELVGYIAVKESQLVKDGKIYIHLDEVPNSHVGRLGEIEIAYGKDLNQIYLPINYTFPTIEIYDAEGIVHDYTTKLKITGTVKYLFRNWKDIIDDPNLSNRNQISTPLRASQRVIEIKKQKREEAIKDALKREKSTGDPNDYSYYIIVEKIEAIE